MELIIIIIIGYFIYKKFIKKDKTEKVKEVDNTPPKPGSRAEKKVLKEQERARKELEREKAEVSNKLKQATGQYGRYQVEAMEYLANAYREGRVVEKDIEKAKYWAEKAFYAILDKKFYVTSDGVSRFYDNIDFFLEGEAKDIEKAEELAWMLYRTGTLSAKEILKDVMKCKYPEKQEEEFNIDALCAMDSLVLSAKCDRSKEVYEEFKEELKTAGLSGQKAFVELLLKKAEVEVDVVDAAFPGATAGLDQKFAVARKIEAAGKDFNKAISAYEPVAQAGHTEAMRRMGLIMRDIVSENCTTDMYKNGQAWIEKAAAAGNALAAYNLDEKNVNIAFIAGLAAQGNLEALYALGNIFAKNWEVAQGFFRNMEELIGDPIADKNGEGIEWLYKLGPKFFIYKLAYYEKLAKAGHEIGYAPSTVRYILMSHLMQEGAVERFGNKAGDRGDFGYSRYVESVAYPAGEAGIARAKAIYSALRSEGYNFSSYERNTLEQAEKGTGVWQYTASKTTPQQRVARAATNLHNYSLAMYYTRKGFGLNYREIEEKLFNSKDTNDLMKSIMGQLGGASKKGSSASVSRSASNEPSLMDEFNANKNCKNLPNCIYDDNNNRWDKMFASENYATYRNYDLGEDTITGCDIESKQAYGYGRGYHWY